MLAERWESADGVPKEVGRLFPEPPTLLLAIPELKTPLPGGRRETQTDLWTLLRVGDRTVSMAIEGKVDEPFGPTVSEWLDDASDGKRIRLAFLCEILGIAEARSGDLRYQLLHRTAAALMEAKRFKTDAAAMIVHSFSPARRWFGDFQAFASSLGGSITQEHPSARVEAEGQELLVGWAEGA
jgi:hypothetical protein